MRTWSRATPRRPSTAAVAASLLATLALSGCGATAVSREGADTTRGKELFQQRCGQCHVLADAGTAGQIGPNLDSGFNARNQGFDEDTYFQVVYEQMKIPAPPMPEFDEEGTKNYLPEQDRISIADYVAAVANKPVARAASNDPKAIFTGSCGSCHTLSDAGTSGAVGPNLDESSIDLQGAVRQIANGGGGMPPFKGQLSDEQIRALAQYILKVRGG
ncbi:MAG: c-type cytochrome [Actinomycetota bacterium]|nr:c-type cytochrome [Actinomycetota bacterium]